VPGLRRRGTLRVLLNFWRNLFRHEPPLEGTYSTGRPRTYSADSGYVYEYSFTGFRRTRRGHDQYTEYVFDVTGGRLERVAVAILLPQDQLREWTARDRDLTASERFGIAKLTLKRALDRFPNPRSLQAEVIPDRAEVSEIADILDL
jgi:hypothetical protein